jgi:hypothetical protein
VIKTIIHTIDKEDIDFPTAEEEDLLWDSIHEMSVDYPNQLAEFISNIESENALYNLIDALDCTDVALDNKTISDAVYRIFLNAESSDMLFATTKFLAKSGKSEYAESVIKAFIDKNFEKYFCGYMNCFPKIFNSQILGALEFILRNGDDVERFHAIGAIGEWRNPHTRKILDKVALTDPDPECRSRALDVLSDYEKNEGIE